MLYIVGTPIGNLKDITLRALEVLRGVDFILCEDTRVTQKLLDRYEIKTSTLSYHQHSQLKKAEYVIQLLKDGKNLALVSDAGTPGISDPGNKLIAEITGVAPLQIAGVAPLQITPIPGPSALTAAASISGFSMDRFVFMGFPPAKNKRKKFFEEAVNSKYPVIFYESPYRILKTLKELSSYTEELSSLKSSLKIVVCRELTKKFETIYRGTIEEVLEKLGREEIKGEFVVIIGK
ncbi:MAG: 16S rRNA (cytidine(1402)-2'-O)-methyltransferase [Candidatus Nealsonbacteria bacterium]|nr:16S rRNA (cytidine(1402)-2'-O)-methyltransferase [Candidatus Nealsonbacteria bacterium]